VRSPFADLCKMFFIINSEFELGVFKGLTP
jgi:hypothetical protein